MRKPLIAGNWKMNNNVTEGLKLVEDLIEQTKSFDDSAEILICAPFTALYPIREKLCGTKIKLGAQNMFYEESGAYTGEISPAMLKDIGVEYVILGHSERRQYFSETDEIINKKIKAAVKFGIKPILCIGETLSQREIGIEKQIVKNQLIEGLKDVSDKDAENLVLAYEPIWAIGTGKTATSQEANEMAAYIRVVISQIYNDDFAQNVVIQYGGSVKGSNANEIMGQSDIDGALVGGASLKANEFAKIIDFKRQAGPINK